MTELGMLQHRQTKSSKESVLQKKSHSKILEDNRADSLNKTRLHQVGNNAFNKTGLPAQLKSGMENLSGKNLDHVRVHYNSSKPALVQAHAYAQGSHIHLASGQEKHLPHELGHVIQQMDGRVPAISSVGGTALNDNPALENEATAMGERALSLSQDKSKNNHVSQAKSVHKNNNNEPIQRRVGFEFQTNWEIEPDPYSAVEGLASLTGSALAESFGLGHADVVGFLTGRLSRAPVTLVKMGINTVSSWTSWALGRTGGQGIVDRVNALKADARPHVLKSIPKGYPLIHGTGWSMSSDEGEMEFVTDPFAENNFAGLATAMAQISAFNLSLLGMQNRSYIPINWYRGVTLLGNLASVKPNGGNIIGMPQMTAGVDLTQIHAMMRDMATPGNTRNHTVRNRGMYLGAVMGSLPPGLRKRSKAYRGIVALMANYVVQSAGLPLAIPKDIAALMARSNLGVAFRQTPEYINRTPGNAGMRALEQQLNHYVYAAAHSAAGTIAFAMVVPVTTGMHLFPSADGMAARNGPTLKQWVDGIVQGDDPMRAGYSRLTSRSMSAMNRLENVGAGGVPGLIMEFRDLPALIPYTQWATYAADKMRWMQYVNNRNRHRKSHP